jgi:hypothetical protein
VWHCTDIYKLAVILKPVVCLVFFISLVRNIFTFNFDSNLVR